MKMHQGNLHIQQGTKRVLDFLISTIARFLLLPILLIIVNAIRLGSPGESILSHRRVGNDGRQITILKFNDMTINFDKYGHFLGHQMIDMVGVK